MRLTRLTVLAACLACRREPVHRLDSMVVQRQDSMRVSETSSPRPPMNEKDSLLWLAWHSPVPVRDLSSLHEKYGFPISHWPDSLLADSLSRAGEEEGPCGMEVTLWVKGLHPITPRYSLDEVAEFDDTAIIRRWSFPANETPIGIRGNEVLASLAPYSNWSRPDSSGIPVLAISPDGSLSAALVRDSVLSDATVFKCPDFVVVPRSSYTLCGEFVDVGSRAKRRLRHEGTCS